MASIDSLPPELLSYCLSFLSARDLAVIAKVNRRFHDASHVDTIWQKRCKRDYNIIKVASFLEDLTYQELYKKVLYKYGHIQGLWQADIGHYGGLFQVKWTGESFVCVQLQPPINPYVDGPLRPKPLFSIKINYERETEILCLQGFWGPHACSITQDEKDSFRSKCLHPEKHKHPEGRQAEYESWLANETQEVMHNILFHGHELLLMKFLVTTATFEGLSSFVRFNPPPPEQNVLIQPGLFKGNYGSHGIEIINFTYNQHKTMFTGVKVTGDPNVPARQITITAELEKPMILTAEQQDRISTLEMIDTPHLDLRLDQLPRQPFRFPVDCNDRFRLNNCEAPRTCIARFHSKGQVASHGFSNPTFIPGHFIIFDNDTIGHIWLELRSISVFCRVKEDAFTANTDSCDNAAGASN